MTKSKNQSSTKRKFIKNSGVNNKAIVGSSVILSTSVNKLQKTFIIGRPKEGIDSNATLQIALIGCGGMGLADMNAALKYKGVKLVAAADLYQTYLDRVKEIYGSDVFTTRDYKELLERKDVDAVIIATPDHWHTDIAVDALEAGKHVYLEKPMVRTLPEGPKLIEAQKKSGKVLEVGSQLLSSLGYEKAKELLNDGAIGTLNFAEGIWTRRTALGAWNYVIPEDANEKTISWDSFLKDGPKIPFSGERFFRWRKYRDYGTGMNGDLYVHIISGLHFVTDSFGPDKIYSSGGNRFWKDGRDVPDVLIGTFDYPECEQHPGFNLLLRCNFVDGSNGSGYYVMRLIGSEGMMEIYDKKVTVIRNKALTFEDPNMILNKIKEEGQRKKIIGPDKMVYEVEEGYKGSLYDHLGYWIKAIQSEGQVVEDVEFGYRAAAPAILCDKSYQEEKALKWDPIKMKEI